MENSLMSFFIWCAGSDKNILNECPDSEKIKHVGLGTLVCVPAILAVFSMTYAISTFVANPYLYLVCGLVWALIVFSFDRYIISTFRKTIDDKKKYKISSDIVSPVFITRIIFSLFLGLAVAHPITLRYFDESISEELKEMNRNNKTRIEKEYDSQKNIYDLKIDSLKKEEQAKLAGINDLNSKYDNEIAGEIIIQHSGDQTITHIPGNGPTAKAIKEHIQSLRSSLQILKTDNNKRRNEYMFIKGNIDIEKDSALSKVVQSNDYLARVEAIERITDRNLQAKVAYYFIIIFFIFVDVLPVLFKVMTPIGPYDLKLNDTENDVLYRSSIFYTSINNVYKKTLDEINDIINLWKNGQDKSFRSLILNISVMLKDVGLKSHDLATYTNTITVPNNTNLDETNIPEHDKEYIKNYSTKFGGVYNQYKDKLAINIENFFSPNFFMFLLILCMAIVINLYFKCNPFVSFTTPLICAPILDSLIKKFKI